MDAYEDSSYHSTSEAEPESDADADADGDGDADGEADADADADPDDPERLLNEWLGELDSLTVDRVSRDEHLLQFRKQALTPLRILNTMGLVVLGFSA
ncbi:Uncharacterized protein GBIM_14712 [Gryllus bimaculatus]|nr:Uncharacterized protein GBIM_14712 [Gryllus bimaculatus]